MTEMTKDMYSAIGRLDNKVFYRCSGSRHHRQSREHEWQLASQQLSAGAQRGRFRGTVS